MFGIPDSDSAMTAAPPSLTQEGTLTPTTAALPSSSVLRDSTSNTLSNGHNNNSSTGNGNANESNAMAALFHGGRTNQRPNFILGGVERQVDETSEKLRENFLAFLERYREASSSSTANTNAPMDPSSSLGTSEMMLSTTQDGSEAATADLFPANNPFYRQQLLEMRNEGLNTIYVDFNHLYRFDDVLANAIADNYYRFEPSLRAALQAFVAAHAPSYARLPNSGVSRDFWVSLYGLGVVHRLRELTTERIGQLLTISGTVTRTSEVRPELFVGAFRCDECTSVVRGIAQQFRYTEPTMCQNQRCQNRASWTLLPDQSIFVNWQKVRVQENSSEMPPGAMPRCLDVIVRNDMVERAKAGDRCAFTGCLVVVPDVTQLALPGSKLEPGQSSALRRDRPGATSEGVTGARALGARELSYRLAFLASYVETAASGAGAGAGNDDAEAEETGAAAAIDPRTRFSASVLEDIERMRTTPQLYQRLVESIAPAIWGHAEIKAGLLLMLFGGVHKQTPEGIRLRGDINVCIVGDPGTAKSQFLRYVTGFLPRSVYTSGKASSAAGLTASVMKDEETGEFTIEAGALMLADTGICAIDEFDKMDLADQVAIHEAMEQQTISIAKAGIQATLNARTSVLAAANPVGGRYDRRKTLRQNVAMTAPIMSRFDLFFVVLDECNEASDYRLSRHILGLHRHRDAAVLPPFTPEQVQRYIRYGRMLAPKLSRPAADLLVDKYKQLRQSDVTGRGASYRVTVRQLESLIRLSEALARLHGDPIVQAKYVREAARLLKASIIRVESEALELDTGASTETGLADAPPTVRLQLRYDDYVRISSMLVYHLRRHEAAVEAAASSEGNEDAAALGIAKTSLVDWYLEQIEAEIENEAQLELRRREAFAVVERLVRKDGVLIELNSREAKHDSDIVVIVHPNYVPA